MRFLIAATAVLAVAGLARATPGQLSDSFSNFADHPAIAYESTPADDAVARLNRAIAAGTVQLTADGPSGYLRSVLDALNVPVQSQIAVFNPDSVQRAIINPRNPRTLFFNDRVAVGWVRGGFIELAAQDPKQGVVFYVLEAPGGQPRFARRDDCLSCHYSYSTAGVPGMLARSIGQFTVDHALPFEKRWDGWYVTGDTHSVPNLGTPFPEHYDSTGYLSTQSDVIALMVFDHQMHMTNLLSRIGWEARVAAAPAERQFEAPVSLAVAAREIVDYLLFVDEAPLPGAVAGSSGFAEQFATAGPRDSQGRSLRQFDLHTRLMRYPCSYMIYSDVFDALPSTAKEAIYLRMWRVLSGADMDAKYSRLALRDRQAVVEILRETKADLPSLFGAITR